MIVIEEGKVFLGEIELRFDDFPWIKDVEGDFNEDRTRYIRRSHFEGVFERVPNGMDGIDGFDHLAVRIRQALLIDVLQ